jgi:hypothetical protein
VTDALLRLYVHLYLTGQHARDRLAARLTDERGDVPGWVLITGMTVALVMAIWSVASGALKALVRNFLSGISFK